MEEILVALEQQLKNDRNLRRTIPSLHVGIGEDDTRALEGTTHVVYILPGNERESFEDNGVFDTRPEDREDDGAVDEIMANQTIAIDNVVLIKCRVNSPDLRSRIVGTQQIPGVCRLWRLVRRAILNRWDLRLNIEQLKIENVQYFKRPRFAEVQITLVWQEIVLYWSGEPAGRRVEERTRAP